MVSDIDCSIIRLSSNRRPNVCFVTLIPYVVLPAFVNLLADCGRTGFRGDGKAAGMTQLSLSDALPGGLTACGVPGHPPTCPHSRQMPIAPSPRSPYISCMRRFSEVMPSFPRRREPRIPSPRRRQAMGRNGRKWKRIKSLPLLATRNEATTIETGPRWSARTSELRAKRGHGGPISSLHRRSKRGQTGPNGSRNQPSPIAPLREGPSFPAKAGNLASLSPTRHSSEGWNPGADEGGAPAHLRQK